MTTHSFFLPCATCGQVLGSAAMDKVCEALSWMNSAGGGGGQGRAQRGAGVDTQNPGACSWPEGHLQGRCLQGSARYWFDNGIRVASIVFKGRPAHASSQSLATVQDKGPK